MADQVSAPAGTISPEDAKMLDVEYTRVRTTAIGKSLDSTENRSVWWRLADIKQFLAYAEQEAQKNGYTLDGIRIYLGTYPSDSSNTGTTLFMAPTGNKLSAPEKTLSTKTTASDDIPGASAFNKGHAGNPPTKSYEN